VGSGAERVLLGLPGRPRRLRRWAGFPPWRAGQDPPAPAVGRQIPTRPAAPGSRPSWPRGHQDCVAAALNALLIPAGQVGMIMAGFVPNSGYKCSKNPSGRPDLNRRPLDPQDGGVGVFAAQKRSAWRGTMGSDLRVVTSHACRVVPRWSPNEFGRPSVPQPSCPDLMIFCSNASRSCATTT
jgi:hypothetical protein